MSLICWLSGEGRELGPLARIPVREWFLFLWLPPHTQVRELVTAPWQPASAVAWYFKTTATIEGRRVWICGSDCVSQRAPITDEQAKALIHFGWPGPVQNLRNEYCAARVLAELPELLRSGARLAHGTSKTRLKEERDEARLQEWESIKIAAQAKRLLRQKQYRERMKKVPDTLEATNRQQKVLRFFGFWSDDNPVKYKEASSLVPKILDEDDNALKWEAYKRLTGDVGHDTPTLILYDEAALAAMVQRLERGS